MGFHCNKRVAWLVCEQGPSCLRTGSLLMRIAHNLFTNGTTLVHEIHKLVGKYIMEQCDVDLCYSFNTEPRFI